VAFFFLFFLFFKKKSRPGRPIVVILSGHDYI
jgi:hypothetical protein